MHRYKIFRLTADSHGQPQDEKLASEVGAFMDTQQLDSGFAEWFVHGASLICVVSYYVEEQDELKKIYGKMRGDHLELVKD